jgi:uncharacterized protein (TIGR00369 family)
MSAFATMQPKLLKQLNPDFDRKIRSSFLGNGITQMGGKLTQVKLGFVEVELPFSEYTQQQHGLFHGSAVAMAADCASGYATYTVLEHDEECVSAEFKVNFLYPARGDKLVARGGIIKVGRTLVIAEATVFVVKNGEEKECAIMLHTCARVKHLKSSEASDC